MILKKIVLISNITEEEVKMSNDTVTISRAEYEALIRNKALKECITDQINMYLNKELWFPLEQLEDLYNHSIDQFDGMRIIIMGLDKDHYYYDGDSLDIHDRESEESVNGTPVDCTESSLIVGYVHHINELGFRTMNTTFLSNCLYLCKFVKL